MNLCGPVRHHDLDEGKENRMQWGEAPTDWTALNGSPRLAGPDMTPDMAAWGIVSVGGAHQHNLHNLAQPVQKGTGCRTSGAR